MMQIKDGMIEDRLYGPIEEISPAAQGVHYGQSVFEGLKAYKEMGKLAFFRPEKLSIL